jgi:hypothetical protein
MFLDFLFFDYHSERVSFLRFEDCLKMLMHERGFDLSDIFIEICGPKRKFINVCRFIKAYLAYKFNDPTKSIEFKNFFAVLFKEILRVN